MFRNTSFTPSSTPRMLLAAVAGSANACQERQDPADASNGRHNDAGMGGGGRVACYAARMDDGSCWDLEDF